MEHSPTFSTMGSLLRVVTSMTETSDGGMVRSITTESHAAAPSRWLPWHAGSRMMSMGSGEGGLGKAER